MKTRPMDGVTLIELVVSLSVLAILLGIAAPAFSNLIDREQANSGSKDLFRALQYARGQAIQRGQTISICGGATACATQGDWRQLLIFHDTDGDGTLGEGDEVLRSMSLPKGYHWNWRNFRSQSHMTFLPTGFTHSLNGTFTLCKEGKALSRIVVNAAGRSRIESTGDSARCL
ncbi:GspH/FimT family pseudopilin [Stutzerimonas tarimensis]|uniref:Type II secretion system protein H n=1 Tax=Stutzerimonas tarimensis TaxID=1507735 RepID=A0ABV7T6D2_9GAMM